MRTIALGQILQDCGLSVHFISIPHNMRLLERIKQEEFHLHLLHQNGEWDVLKDSNEVLKIAKDLKVDWLITDGYHFNTGYQEIIKEAGYKLMSIDDIAECHYISDIILNQNIHATKEMYSAEEYTNFFLGPEYSLIRREFLKAKQGFERIIAPEVTHILVTIGGADEHNITLRILHALNLLEKFNFKIKVIMGALNPHYDEIVKFSKKNRNSIEVLFNLSYELPELIKWADLAISSGGSIIWEYALFGTPTLVVVTAKNQEALVDKLKENQLIYKSGWHYKVDENLLSAQIETLCDNYKLRMSLSTNIQKIVNPRLIQKLIEILVK